MNKSLKMLYDEHDVIMNAIDIVSNASSFIGKDDKEYEVIIRKLIHFFKAYADRYHHYKEEMILFPELSRRNELLGDGVIKEMLDNHDDFRGMIHLAEKKLNEKDYVLAQKLLEKYAEALLYHIAVENEELFHTAETLLSPEELDNIYYRFQDCDRELGEKMKQELADIIESMRKQFVLTEQ